VDAETVRSPQRLLSAEELAAYLRVPVSTLYVWRTRGNGPQALKVGRHLRYRSDDVEDWLERRKVPA
jgi:excisionase family DNA binding protein